MDTISPAELAEREKEQIIASIIESAERDPEGTEIPTLITLRYGSKELDIVYFTDKNTFATAVEGYEDREKKPEETRFLYTAAKRLMQEISNRPQVEIEYALETSDEKMLSFAQTHGKQIFDWDLATEEELNLKKGNIVKSWTFKKTFQPIAS